jgi:hypothetical protein
LRHINYERIGFVEIYNLQLLQKLHFLRHEWSAQPDLLEPIQKAIKELTEVVSAALSSTDKLEQCYGSV